jgi:hypothetical protein
MNNLQSNEHDLVGNWVEGSEGLQADETAQRIDWLVTTVLEKVADSPQAGAWETLYRDPGDGRFWERTYPRGEMHGGGPPRLRYISTEDARVKYGAASGV